MARLKYGMVGGGRDAFIGAVHRKACALLNVAGYYDGLAAFLDHAVDERFLRPEHRGMLLCGDTPTAVLDALERFDAPLVDKWIDRPSQT